jgi:hypothetical protein
MQKYISLSPHYDDIAISRYGPARTQRSQRFNAGRLEIVQPTLIGNETATVRKIPSHAIHIFEEVCVTAGIRTNIDVDDAVEGPLQQMVVRQDGVLITNNDFKAL